MEKLLIATDFDGTLNRHGVIDGATRAAIDRWRADGRYFGVVTGRGLDFCDVARREQLPFDYLILCNGSLILAADAHVLFESLIPMETYHALEAVMAGYPDIAFYSQSEGVPEPHYYATFPSAERALQVRAALLPVFGDRLSIFVNGPHINIGNRGTGKAEGVSFILQHFGLPADAAAVVGDDYNDLEMILAHGGWAVASGKPDVVRQAQHQCESVGDLIQALLSQ